MSDALKHECGIALLQLKAPPNQVEQEFGSKFGLRKMYLLLEKMHNRGQDGAGLASLNLNAPPGFPRLDRVRSDARQPILDLFRQIEQAQEKGAGLVKPFDGQLFLGHVRYGTFGRYGVEACHPFLRDNNWPSRMLAVAGNFNLTNTPELFQQLLELGQHPKQMADTVTVMERIGHFLDEEVERCYEALKTAGENDKSAISKAMEEVLDLTPVLRQAFKKFDGGYVMGGFNGQGHAFVVRDPNGIRPAWMYENQHLVVVASERAVIQTVFDAPLDEVQELNPGEGLLLSPGKESRRVEVLEPQAKTSCSFERIYFSRGTDQDIYRERKKLGAFLTPEVLKAIDGDLEHTVFSFIPNTAELAFYGLIKGLEEQIKTSALEALRKNSAWDEQRVERLFNQKPRVEKVAVKDVKARTFITNDAHRSDMVQHVYDITYGSIRAGEDNLVVLDDSIVRGTTLRESILKMLSRLNPKTLVVVSSAPQIRYPDCYGIDMARLNDLAAFRAAVSCLVKQGKVGLMEALYEEVLAAIAEGSDGEKNYVQALYAAVDNNNILEEMAQMLKPEELKCPLRFVFQRVAHLHSACPEHVGDWYFSGNYPTQGGNRFVNRAFVHFMEGSDGRSV